MRFIGLSTATKSRQRKLQEGQAIVLIALLLLVLFAMLGLAIDSGRAYVDKRDLQTAVDAAALAAGDWYENFSDLTGSTLPQSEQVFQTDLHLYSGPSSNTCTPPCPTFVGPLSNLRQDNYSLSYNSGSYTLTVSATNTQFNGYQFVFTATHYLPLAFMQIFGGPTTATIVATATSIVGNQRQTPALLTLSSDACATHLQGAGSLTVLGDVYTNGTACVDANLHLAGNCYGAAGSNCTAATYYCYSQTPGVPPYAPPCFGTDLLGGPYVPAPPLPDPGYLSPSVGLYNGAGSFIPRGTYTELTPGVFNGFSLSGPGCYFLDAGIYQWNGGYVSHGGMVSNELKPPDEPLYSAPGTILQTGGNTFWGAGGCAGSFAVATAPVGGGQGLSHNGGGLWGVEVTSVRYDRFPDPNFRSGSGNPCEFAPGCVRESAPSACHQVPEIDASNQGIDVNITVNSPGAQYYNVYVNPNGCLPYPGNSRNDFSFVNTYPAPAVAATLTGGIAGGGWSCAAAGVTFCNINSNTISNSPTVRTHNCSGWARANQFCWAPDDETTPTCFSVCPPAPAVPQENAAMSLEYAPAWTSGDVANENYCKETPPSGGDPTSPCSTAKITPGAVQFYMGPTDCVDQNGNGYTHVFSGEQYNWIVIYQLPAVLPAVAPFCNPNHLLGNALTQYIGTIYTPSSNWTIQGSDKSPLSGQVICWVATVTGSGQAGIDFNPNYAPAPPAARLIN
jgi:Flp pilus assembly protein TadG